MGKKDGVSSSDLMKVMQDDDIMNEKLKGAMPSTSVGGTINGIDDSATANGMLLIKILY